MIRGTTAQFRFKLPYTRSELSWVTIKFWQRGNTGTVEAPLPIIKQLIHCDAPYGSKELLVSLTAEETFRFSDKHKASVQLRAQHAASGTIFGTRTRLVTVYPMPDDITGDDIIGGEPTLPMPDEDGWVILDGQPITT